MHHALIVDDDLDSAKLMAALMAGQNFSVASAHNLRDARRQLALHQPDLVLLDLKLPDGSGMELFEDADLIANSMVVLVTGHASLETSIEALRLGAADYLVKPIGITHLEGVLSRVMRPSQLKSEVADLTAELEKSGHFGDLWGRSEAMQQIYEQVSRVAATGVSVFLTGESGTGKEVVARTVHALSRRRNAPFLAINCGAISPNLIESEIFGHEKGSFTGAERQHLGFFERANGGTLFLDEITEMPPELQVKLLRVLETGSFMRVGSAQEQDADVRIIAATNRPIEDAVAGGHLREDLLYRLNVFPIQLPPLRERPEDVALLAEHFLTEICEREGKKRRFTPEALAALGGWRWPGNVRELRNAVQRAFVMAAGEAIDGQWLPQEGGAAAQGRGASGARPSASLSLPIGTSLNEAEKSLILATLNHFEQNRERTASALGVSMKTLYNRLKDYAEPAAGLQRAAKP
ncbi:MAG: sigma-54 dependent transcriptional regulator [Burkholderiales bacterium]